MALVLGLMAALWGLGLWLGAPRRQRLLVTAGLWGAVVLGHLLLPAGHALRAATGGDARVWLVLGGLAVVVWGYRVALGRLRARAAAQAPQPADAPGFSRTELDRYARHILLREVGGTGQRRLKQARVLVVGAGGIGSPVLLYLAAAGVGTLGVIDDDVVEGSNLQRQVIHTDARIGLPKVFSAEAAVAALNPFVTLRPYRRRLTGDMARDLFAAYDLILDGSDNFDTRYLVNRAAVAAGKPVIAGAMTQWEGQVALWHPAAGGPCYECVFPVRPAPGLAPACAEAGVIAPLPGVIGSIMAAEAIKHLTGAGQTLRGRLMIHDALMAEVRVIETARRPDCPCCGAMAG